ncbi:Transmembrane protein 43 [Acropora cervicornis]|uniref:Transmembrane protein 43 n=1 Tax=Acropora cervicornis TaxID=6130 RepID=A0AAD9R1T6_ACRCE|nr:Transmembrane protein 43 [Acropora cervicornis]
MYRTQLTQETIDIVSVGEDNIPMSNPSAPGMHHHKDDGYDSHTRISYKENPGFFGQIKQSFSAALMGILLVITSFPVIYWNEGRAVQTSLSLDEGLKQVFSLQVIDQINPGNQNRLVHLTGPLQTQRALSDPEYGVAVRAVKLRRKVEMYQWVEHTSTRSGSFDKPSGHMNPSSFPVTSYTNEADFVQVGAFALSKGLIAKINDFKPLTPKDLVQTGRKRYIHDGMFYVSDDPFYPSVGDVRVQFYYAGLSGKAGAGLGDPLKVSIVAKQQDSTLSHYTTESGDTIEFLYNGQVSAKEIFDAEHSANTILTWFLRGVGWLLMFFGFQLMTSILTVMISWVPIISDIVGLGLTLFCLCFATSLSLVTIAIAWIAHRPLLGLTLLVAAAIPILLSKDRAQRVGHRKS